MQVIVTDVSDIKNTSDILIRGNIDCDEAQQLLNEIKNKYKYPLVPCIVDDDYPLWQLD